MVNEFHNTLNPFNPKFHYPKALLMMLIAILNGIEPLYTFTNPKTPLICGPWVYCTAILHSWSYLAGFRIMIFKRPSLMAAHYLICWQMALNPASF